MLVQVASRFQSNIQIASGDKQVNAKSIMGMMALGLDNGEEIVITADGPDERDAVAEVRTYLTQDAVSDRQ